MSKRTKKLKQKAVSQRVFHQEVITQLLALSTSSFGLVAALAWNDAIQNLVKQYIDRFFPASSGIISRFAYAVIVTILAVTITYQLSRLGTQAASGNKQKP